MAKCRGCGGWTNEYESPGLGWMHWSCEVERIKSIEEEQIGIANDVCAENTRLRSQLAKANDESNAVRREMLKFRVKAQVVDKYKEENTRLRAELAKALGDWPRCRECNSELSTCGEMTEDGPSMDCLVCQLRAELDTAKHQRGYACAQLSDAEFQVGRLRAELAEARKGNDELRGSIQLVCKSFAEAQKELAEAKKDGERLRGAALELLLVAVLRGDNSLPHPEDDPLLWTARMQTAWDELDAAMAEESRE